MTVYYYDKFTGTAGTLLTSHTADSGATWPNDANHLVSTNLIELDGNGMVFSSGTATTLQIPSATQPATQNFEILYSFVRLTALTGHESGVELLRSTPFTGAAEDFGLVYCEGYNGYTGFYFQHSNVNKGTGAAGPAVGVTWNIKVDVSTSSGVTYFAASYSTTSGGPWTVLTSWSIATPSDAITTGLRFAHASGSTAATATTGHHIGALYVQDIPAPSSATLTGPTGALFSTPADFTVGLNEPAGTGGVAVTLSSSNISDTFQATQGGANVTSITFAAGQSSGTFWLTPGGATGNRTITITTSPTLTCPGSPFTYDALPAATGYTVTGVTGGHQLVPVTWTITLVGGDFAGTITATPGGGTGQCQIFSPTLITFTGNGTLSKVFSFTPLDTDSVTFTFTNSGSLTDPSPMTYTATRIYYQDTFAGAAGTSITIHNSNALPGLAGSHYTVTGAGTLELDGGSEDGGNGMVYLATSGDTYALTNATLPTWNSSTPVEILFDIVQMTSEAGSYGGIVLMHSTGEILNIRMGPNEAIMGFYQNGTLQTAYTTDRLPPVDTVWTIKVDFATAGAYAAIQTYYWNGTGWSGLFDSIYPLSWGPLISGLPTAIAVGPYLQGATGTATSGIHIGNIIVQDPAPAPPNCAISNAYVTTGGQSVAFFFNTISGSTPVTPTAMNYAPSFFLNGASIGVGVNAWVTGYHSCAIIQLQPGVQVNPGDILTVITPASWMSCGTNNAVNGVSNLEVTNYSGVSCFGTGSLAKTFKPGLNFSDIGSTDSTLYQLLKNWRYRLTSQWLGGYPTNMGFTQIDMSLYNMNSANGIDATSYPGPTGYFAIGFDDNYQSHSGAAPTTLAIHANAFQAGAIVTQDATCLSVTNTGNPDGTSQFYMFKVDHDSAVTGLDVPIVLRWNNANQTPYISNLWIVGPGDFTYTPGIPLSFDRSQSYALSSTTLSRLANGLGSMRWIDSTLGYANGCSMTEPWEETRLNAFSWNQTLQPPLSGVSSSIAYSQARPFDPAVSTYIYQAWLGDQVGSTWTCSSGLSADITTTTGTTITIASASTDPIFRGVKIQIDSEQMYVKTLSGTSTLTVIRGAFGTTGATHSSGATVMILSKRWAWTSLQNIYNLIAVGVGALNQYVELVTIAPHNLTMPIGFNLGGNFPTFTCTDGSTMQISGGGLPWMLVTGPNTFIYMAGGGTSSTAVTLETTYSLSSSTPSSSNPSGGNGFPMELIAIVTGSFPGTHIHVNISLAATDAYVYDVALKILNNFPAGRRVYVELADEPWNWGFSEYNACRFLSNLAGVPNCYYYVVVRTGQIRTIFRNVFGSRANEIYVLVNNIWTGVAPWVEYTGTPTSDKISAFPSLQIAAYYGVTIDTHAAAPYINLDNGAATISAWNNANIQQMIDIYVHDMYYNQQGWPAWLASHRALMGAYNATSVSPNFNGTTGTCFLYGYEGGFGAPPPGINNCTALSHDLPFDPNWLIIEQDFYALLQESGFVNVNLYSYDIYYDSSANWGLYHWPYQPYGKGDGSDGKANNRLCLATPGFEYSKAATTNQDQQNVSVRGQAFLEWMQPSQGKKRMLFVPYRFVNR